MGNEDLSSGRQFDDSRQSVVLDILQLSDRYFQVLGSAFSSATAKASLIVILSLPLLLLYINIVYNIFIYSKDAHLRS